MPDALDRAIRHARRWLDSFADGSAGAAVAAESILERIDTALPENGTPAPAVIDELAAAVEGGLHRNNGGRFFAWVMGGATEAALASDWLVSAWDQNAALAKVGPAVSAVEEVAGRWMKELLDLPVEASFAFTTGCQMAHVTALAAARYAVLQQFGWDVETDGLTGAPRVSVIVNEQRHHSVDKAVRLLGLGSSSLIAAETGSDGAMTSVGLAAALAEAGGPAIVVLNAADLNIGAFDPFAELIPIARNANAWVHIDGAFGLFARVSDRYAALVDGVDLGDSWATDAHKWLNVPFDCGVAIVRDRDAHRAAMAIRGDYIAPSDGARDPIDWNPEWSRRARALPVYAALKELGRAGVADIVERSCQACAELVGRIAALPGARALATPVLNQGLIRFERAGRSVRDNDRFTLEIMRRINASGYAFFSGTVWQGLAAMRISVVGWRTSTDEIDRTVAAVAAALRRD